jgi:uncharacterized membrane protein
MIENCFRYSLKVWLTTIAAGSFALGLGTGLWPIDQTIEMCLCIALVAYFLSFPTWIIFLVAVFILVKVNHSNYTKKIFLHLFSAILTLTTIIFLEPNSERLSSSFPIIAIYLISLTASIHFYKLPQLYIDHQENSTT